MRPWWLIGERHFALPFGASLYICIGGAAIAFNPMSTQMRELALTRKDQPKRKGLVPLIFLICGEGREFEEMMKAIDSRFDGGT